MAFSPNGRTLAAGNFDTVTLWSIPPTVLTSSNEAPVSAVAFSPHGHTLATVNDDGTTQLWNVTNPAHPHPLGQPLTTSKGNSVYAVAFSPHGHTLATGNDDGTTLLWNPNVQYAINRICATAGGLTPRQWHQYIGQLAYQPMCG